MMSSDDIRKLPLPAVIQRCREETALYYQGRKHDARFCFELFRRAFEDENQGAWAAINKRYAAQIESWVRLFLNNNAKKEDVDDLVNGSLARFWAGIVRGNLQFDSLARILAYLKKVTFSEVSDVGRKRKSDALKYSGEFDLHAPSDDDPEETARANVRAKRFWEEILKRAKNEQERVYARLGWMLGYTPKQISAEKEDLFPSVDVVNQTRANYIARLRRDVELRALVGDLFDFLDDQGDGYDDEEDDGTAPVGVRVDGGDDDSGFDEAAVEIDPEEARVAEESEEFAT